MELMEALRPVVADEEQTLRRFMGNRALYQKFVLKFPQDENMSLLEKAAAGEDWPAVERAAQHPKGGCRQPGLCRTGAGPAADLVAALRQGAAGSDLSPLLDGCAPATATSWRPSPAATAKTASKIAWRGGTARADTLPRHPFDCR